MWPQRACGFFGFSRCALGAESIIGVSRHRLSEWLPCAGPSPCISLCGVVLGIQPCSGDVSPAFFAGQFFWNAAVCVFGLSFFERRALQQGWVGRLCVPLRKHLLSKKKNALVNKWDNRKEGERSKIGKRRKREIGYTDTVKKRNR